MLAFLSSFYFILFFFALDEVKKVLPEKKTSPILLKNEIRLYRIISKTQKFWVERKRDFSPSHFASQFYNYVSHKENIRNYVK